MYVMVTGLDAQQSETVELLSITHLKTGENYAENFLQRVGTQGMLKYDDDIEMYRCTRPAYEYIQEALAAHETLLAIYDAVSSDFWGNIEATKSLLNGVDIKIKKG